MKKWILLLFLVIVAGFGIAACQRELPEKIETGQTVYLLNSDKTGLVPETVSLNTESTDEKINEIINLLQTGTQTAAASIPQNVKVEKVELDDAKVVLRFTESYNQLTAIEEMICRSSIVKSLTELVEVESVEFYIGSVPYKNADGTMMGSMGSDDVVLDFSTATEEPKATTVTLYFSDEEAMYLVPVQVDVTLKAEDQLEATVLNLLIAGPTVEGLYATIPPETKIKNIYTNDGICYVDLSEEFVTKHSGGSTGETMTVFSIVNSLCELPTITKVQFLIEGTVRDEYKGHLQFNVPFQKNMDIIKQQ